MEIKRDVFQTCLKQEGFASQSTAWICGDFLEILESQYFVYSDFPQVGGSARGTGEKDENDSSWRAAFRAQKHVRRLINTNRLFYMLTLTFALENTARETFNLVDSDTQRDRDAVYKKWKYFLRRIKRVFIGEEPLKWVMILETHNSVRTHPQKVGTYHLHVALDRPICPLIAHAIWGHGIVDLQNFTKTPDGRERKTIDNPGAYISKYISKEGAKRNAEQGKKRYSASRTLKRPQKISYQGLVDELETVAGEQVFFAEKKIYDPEGREVLLKRYKTYLIKDLEEMEMLRQQYFKGGGTIDARDFDENTGRLRRIESKVLPIADTGFLRYREKDGKSVCFPLVSDSGVDLRAEYEFEKRKRQAEKARNGANAELGSRKTTESIVGDDWWRVKFS